MLRGNLASRPFYNERLVTAVLTLVAVLAVALTAFNVSELLSLSRERSGLVGRINRDEQLADRITTQATALQKSVDRSRLQVLAGATREANALIDARTFSWTTFFGYLEQTLPIDVRLVSVSPRVERGQIRVTMIVVARTTGNINTFIDALMDTGAFYDVLPHDQNGNDDGTVTSQIQAYYYPPSAGGAARPARKGRP